MTVWNICSNGQFSITHQGAPLNISLSSLKPKQRTQRRHDRIVQTQAQQAKQGGDVSLSMLRDELLEGSILRNVSKCFIQYPLSQLRTWQTTASWKSL